MSAVRGVHTLADLRDRCRIDAETGCWLWSLACAAPRNCLTPVVHMGAHGKTMTAARAAWLLAGKKLEPGQVVWRHVCGADLCINTQHCRAGTRAEMQAAIAATGRNRGRPERAAINALARASQILPVEKVRQAEALFAAGVLQKDVRAQLGLGQKVAAAIREGRHAHSVGRQRLVRGASVFSLGAAA